MTELVTAREIPSERPLAWRLAHDARVRYVLLVGALAGAYYGAAQIGYELKFTGAVAAIVWLPVGVGIAFLYLGGLSLWPGVVLGDLLANQYETLPVGSAIGQTIGNTLEVVVAAYLIRRLVRNGRPLESVAGVCGLLVAIFAGTAVSATIGPLSLRLGNVLSTSDLPHVWHTWWLGDTAGALVVVPLALAWWRPLDLSWTRARIAEGALMLSAVIVLTEIALRTDRPLVYIVFPDADLGRAALRAARRHARGRRGRRLHALEDGASRGAVRRRLDPAQHAQHAAVRLGRGAVDDVPRRGRRRARGDRERVARVAGAPDRRWRTVSAGGWRTTSTTAPSSR